jgi:PAS domain S-box-containing protein
MGADAWFGPAAEAVGRPTALPPDDQPSPTDLGDLPELVVTWAGRLAGTPDALLYLVERAGQRLVVRHGTGRFAAGVGGSVRKGEELAGEVWRTGAPLVLAEDARAGAALGVPLLSDHAVVGVLVVAFGEPGRTFGRADIERLRGVGELAGVAIDHAGRQAGDWLPEPEARYRALFEQVPAVIYSEVHTPGGTYYYQSPQIERMLGYTPEEGTPPSHWRTVLHPEDRDWVVAEDERCDRTGEPWFAQYRVIAKDGRVVWVRDHAVLVPGEHVERIVENLLAQRRPPHHAGHARLGGARSPPRGRAAGGRGRRRRGVPRAAGGVVRAVSAGTAGTHSHARGRHRPDAGGPLRRAARRAGVGRGPSRRRRVVPGAAFPTLPSQLLLGRPGNWYLVHPARLLPGFCAVGAAPVLP